MTVLCEVINESVSAQDSYPIAYLESLSASAKGLHSIGSGIGYSMNDSATLSEGYIARVTLNVGESVVVASVPIEKFHTTMTQSDSVRVRDRYRLAESIALADAVTATHGLYLGTLTSAYERAHALEALVGSLRMAANVSDDVNATAKLLSSYVASLQDVSLAQMAQSSRVSITVASLEGVVISDAPSASTKVTMLPIKDTATAAESATTRALLHAVIHTTTSAYDALLTSDPLAIAWVLNTESSAVSWYRNFQFNSIAQSERATYAVGADGLYQVIGDTDAGEAIYATVYCGFNDYKTSATKRMDAMYFGYQCDGQLLIEVDTQECTHPASQYTLETRLAPLPRNTRVHTGKGRTGRFWSIRFSNIAGSGFSVYDIEIDFAVSSRRI